MAMLVITRGYMLKSLTSPEGISSRFLRSVALLISRFSAYQMSHPCVVRIRGVPADRSPALLGHKKLIWIWIEHERYYTILWGMNIHVSPINGGCNTYIHLRD